MKKKLKTVSAIFALTVAMWLPVCAFAVETTDTLQAIETDSFASDTIMVQEIAVQGDSVAQKVSLLQRIENWYERNTNYYSITALMAIESSFIPFPSEIVIPPAAYIASNPESDLNIVLVVLFGTLGALIGALINYFLSMWLGRPIIYKFADSKLGHLLLLSGEKIEKAEAYFVKNGNISTFVGRLVPGIRQLISIPAGLAKMNLGSFVLYTCLGAGIWNIILALIGYLAHGQKDLIDKYSSELSWVLLGLGVLLVLYLIYKSVKSKKCKKQQ